MPDARATSPLLNEPLRSYDECRRPDALTRREMSVLRSIRTGRGLGTRTLWATEIGTGYSPAVFHALLGSLRAKGMIDTWTADGGVCVKMLPAGFLRSAPDGGRREAAE